MTWFKSICTKQEMQIKYMKLNCSEGSRYHITWNDTKNKFRWIFRNCLDFFKIIHSFIISSSVKVLYPGQGCGGSGAYPGNTGPEVGELTLIHMYTYS